MQCGTKLVPLNSNACAMEHGLASVVDEVVRRRQPEIDIGQSPCRKVRPWLDEYKGRDDQLYAAEDQLNPDIQIVTATADFGDKRGILDERSLCAASRT